MAGPGVAEPDAQSLFRREAVRHNTPGLFGEVVLAAPPATWALSLLALAAAGLAGGLLLSLEVEGEPLWRWLWG